MPGHIDHIIDAAKDAEIAVGGQHRAIACEVGPVMPVFTLLVTTVFLIVDLHKALGLAPDGLEDAGPRVTDANVAGSSTASFDGLALFIVDHRVDAQHARSTTARLHRFQSW